jgi:5-bromo-4-chloroindolyl phosphate hydrolysis protein
LNVRLKLMYFGAWNSKILILIGILFLSVIICRIVVSTVLIANGSNFELLNAPTWLSEKRNEYQVSKCNIL